MAKKPTTIADFTKALKALKVEIPEGSKLKDLKVLLESAGKKEEGNDDRITADGEGKAEGEKNQEDDSKITPPKETKAKKEEEKGDYLQKYQYKKDLPVGDPRTNPDAGSKAERIKIDLLKQPRISVVIPRADGEDPKVTMSVTLNGYRLDFPKQEYLSLPEQIAELIMDSQKQTAAALRPYRIDRDKGTENALA